MSGDLTAAQRVLSTPELLLEVFLVLDKPGHFGVVNKTFREIARDPVNLIKHFERRYYPFEIMYELLSRPSVYQKVDNLVQVSFLCEAALQASDRSADLSFARRSGVTLLRSDLAVQCRTSGNAGTPREPSTTLQYGHRTYSPFY
jgi:hypothetical protein